MAEFDPGPLDQLITIQRETLAPDGMGGHDVIVDDFATDVWATVRALNGREIVRYDALQATAMVRFIIRFRSDIQHGDRIVWQGDVHNIRYIPPSSGRDPYLQIDAERGVAM